MNTLGQFIGLVGITLPQSPLHLAIGMFDGLHRGHQAVIRPAVAAARQSGGVAAVLTFWPHPSVVLRPQGEPIRMLMQPDEKARRLRALGVAAVITQPFTPEFAAWAAAGFLARLKSYLPNLAAVYVGENWRYGSGRVGDVALLKSEGARLGLHVESVPRVLVDAEPISSTRIRAELEMGAMGTANALLGYAFYARGVVTAGQGLGRQMGFPTLNLNWQPDVRLRLGVYAVTVAREGDASGLNAVANYGVRPTVAGTDAPVLEVHVLENCSWGPGDELCVTFHHFLRAEQKFPHLETLKKQIDMDRETARAWLARQQ